MSSICSWMVLGWMDSRSPLVAWLQVEELEQRVVVLEDEIRTRDIRLAVLGSEKEQLSSAQAEGAFKYAMGADSCERGYVFVTD